jgi:formylglycine-generating enzyme required for sulfatase activity
VDVTRELDPGSYLVVGVAPDRYATRYPFFVRRGEERTLHIVLPLAASVPAGMIYVPAGRTLYGSSDDEATRGILTHQPVHDIEVGAFLIAQTEVTNADYLAFVDSLPASSREARLPRGIVRGKDGRLVWRLRGKTLTEDEPYCIGAQSCVSWYGLPVDGVSREDAARFAEWLAQSGRLPSARLCTDREWERAARGADGRRYPSTNRDPKPDEACTILTNGSDPLRAGPCAVGTHPASRSPFGVDDMAGSMWEWTSTPPDVALPNQAEFRGGSWTESGIFLSISNRATSGATERLRARGIRVCADVK